MNNAEELRAALVSVINAGTRPPALWPIAYIKYPAREVKLTELSSNNTYEVALAIRGYEYKHRGPRPKLLLEIDVEQIRIALNALLDGNLYVIAVENHQTYIAIYMEVKNEYF